VCPDIGGIELLFDPVFFAVKDHPVDLLLGRHAGGRIFLFRLRACARSACIREILDEPLQSVGPSVEDQIVRHLPLRRRDLGVRADVCGIYDRGVETGLHAVVKEYRVEHPASFRRQSEAHI
jgi:hypothetical protein